MAMTIHRLAQRSDLGLELVAGHEHGQRTVGWAHAIELADPTPYLSGGELVMTTGMNVGTTDCVQSDYMARLATAGVAALAFDTGTTFAAVPRGIIGAGDQLGIPVLAVPARTPFIAITRAVIDEVTADEIRVVQGVVQQQEALARATLRAGIPAVVDTLANALGCTVAVVSSDGIPLAAAGPDTDRVIQYAASHVEEASDHRRYAGRVVSDGDGYCTIQPLRVTGAVRGHLFVRATTPLTAPQRVLVAHALALASIDLDKPAKVLDAEQRLRGAVAQALFAQPHIVDDGILRYFDFDPDGSVVVAVVSGSGPILPALTVARDALGDAAVAHLICAQGNELAVVLPADDSSQASALHRTMSAQLRRGLRTGLGAPTRFSDVRLGLSQARVAAEATNRLGGLCRFTEMGVFDVLLGTRGTSGLEVLSDRLTALDAFDRQFPADVGLLETLTAYLRHNGQMESASSTLGVHRHTMRNRLAKLRELTGCDLDSADTRAELWLAIKARELLGMYEFRNEDVALTRD